MDPHLSQLTVFMGLCLFKYLAYPCTNAPYLCQAQKKARYIALGHPHNDVAAMCISAYCGQGQLTSGIVVSQRLAKLSRQLDGDLVLEALPLLVGERQIARIGADAKHIGVDQFDRGLVGALVSALRERLEPRSKRREQSKGERERPDMLHLSSPRHSFSAVVALSTLSTRPGGRPRAMAPVERPRI